MGKGNRKYYQMDYYNAQKNAKSYLDNMAGMALSMGRRLTKFVDLSKGKLHGREFDILFGRLNLYASAFEQYGQLGDILTNNIVSANNAVCNAMGGHTELTDEYLTEIEEKISNCNSLIYATNSNIGTLEGAAQDKQKRVLEGYRSNLASLMAEKKQFEELLDATEAADSAGVSGVGDVTVKIDALKGTMMY